jgi:hypothetical protein
MGTRVLIAVLCRRTSSPQRSKGVLLFRLTNFQIGESEGTQLTHHLLSVANLNVHGYQLDSRGCLGNFPETGSSSCEETSANRFIEFGNDASKKMARRSGA